jgi:hypothetical protein
MTFRAVTKPGLYGYDRGVSEKWVKRGYSILGIE